jgi:hypothetical protein
MSAPDFPGDDPDDFPGEETAIMACAGEGCFCRRGMPVHPPVLMMFDRERGEYTPARGERCAARWACGGYGHAAGQICGRVATHEICDIPVCEHHHKRARKELHDEFCDLPEALEVTRQVHLERLRLDREQGKARQELFKEQIRLQGELEKARVDAAEAAESARSVVYYAQRASDGLIKIGTSRRIVGRLVALKGEHGSLQLLALHSGTHKEEHELHRKFAALRVEGEWFRPDLPLIDHIVWVRAGDLYLSKDLPERVHAEELRVVLRRLKREAREARKRESAA